MEQLNNQVEFLEDKSSNGNVRDWPGKKKRNLSLAEIYRMIKESYRKIHSEKFNRFFNREERCRMCATILKYKRDKNGKRTLYEAYFMYHPHFHVLLVVNKSYFTSRYFLKHEEWQKLWAKAMKLDYLPQVNIKKVKGNTAEAVAEVAKYSTKDSDYVIEKDLDLSANVVEVLDYALERRRLVSFSGIMKEYHQKLNLDDTEDGDLVHIDSEKDEELEGELTLETYAWNVGYMNYVRV